MLHSRSVLSCCLFMLLCGTCYADDPKTPHQLLFIGNSLTYTNDLPTLVQEMYVAVKQPKPLVEAITQPGASLGDHWQSPATRQAITRRKWDYIILQQGPSSLADSQREFLRDMEAARPWLKQSGARPALFMVWPDANRLRFFPQVRQAYANAAKSVDGIFLPAGLAIQNILEKDKTAQLFSDGLHPTPLGTYLAALVITARLNEISSEKLPSRITWARHYSIQLNNQQFQTCLAAVESALKDTGK